LNWSGATTLPGTADTAVIANGGTATITTTGAACNALLLGTTASPNTVQMTGGSFSAGAEFVWADLGRLVSRRNGDLCA
jgi:hypothetical protein